MHSLAGRQRHLELQVTPPMACLGGTPSVLGPWCSLRTLEGAGRGESELSGLGGRGGGGGRKSGFAPSQQPNLLTSQSVFFKEAEHSRGKPPPVKTFP